MIISGPIPEGSPIVMPITGSRSMARCYPFKPTSKYFIIVFHPRPVNSNKAKGARHKGYQKSIVLTQSAGVR